ncbi:fumarylacetoacetate hydrolase family protein [Niveispirillum sp.]|uniref:fumarylacetoacetate hydrolase family protein n=1 Tax=Niveispirillum sp. TaxID=1917217 RepID=UPI001B70FC70|nr:fumarylacetoacetate hydrolase family protein [Niveispirillum sp.]MBP7338613.1 fumarylacetoacetate hydrolase family protein [Niveispirillum sp.]
MKLLRYSVGSAPAVLGALVEGDVVPLSALPVPPGDMGALIAGWGRLADDAREIAWRATGRIKLDEVHVLAPLARPGKIFAIGLNYADHIAESKLGTPEQQVWFTKAVTAIHGPYDPVEIPHEPSCVDYEVEMVAIIGRGGRDIGRGDAPGAIFGYCVGNDVTERRWQHSSSQWSLGKSFDTHAPIGPWITTADEVTDPHALDIKCWVNEELRQNSNTSHLVFNLWDQIEHLSHAMTLEPGDLIFTGTPGGIGAAMDPRRFLQPSDLVRCEIAGLGHIENSLRLRG